MAGTHTFFSDLCTELVIPEDGILSRPIHSDEHVRMVLFGFSKGQELTDHAASSPAVLYVVQGEARLGLGEETVEAKAGSCVHMPAELTHSVYAVTPLVLLLVLVRHGDDGD